MEQPDIVERAREYATSDHERGCQGRCYACTCGYDDKRDPLIMEMAAEIERLRDELEIWKDRYHAEHQDHEATMKAWDEERSGL